VSKASEVTSFRSVRRSAFIRLKSTFSIRKKAPFALVETTLA
jgi:hypothetical protein